MKDFSKKLMIFASVIFALTWTAAVLSWFILRDVPDSVLQFVCVLYGALGVTYCCKEGYEYRCDKKKERCGNE